MNQAMYSIGQIIHHRLFGYRGVVVDVDPVFQGTEEWYEAMAQSRPPRDEPWYHVLVDGQPVETYVAQRNLEPGDPSVPVEHPYVETFFSSFENGMYRARTQVN
ncbi:DNA-binding protein [Thioalkalivibrio denitrificans]|uniref:Heat shock protein HspQ n=1 Tax=Thioalkalivibrio denitrificans TaxID=108003 RepID=A0A1V3NU87_9GAMM|nr:heat shock protein HspQ [Thioalkalivibrio denitrificans]OOG28591.1 DNA-binding protein [Thioalkalivibrio denitrificans]